MGLAASQARLLTITARKADCEFQSMKLSHEKIALSRDMERISDEYQAAMGKTKLIYDYYGSGTSEMALSYGLLMKPSVYNDYYPKLITDSNNRTVLSGPYAAAARAAGIPKEGFNGTPSSEIRNRFVQALRDNGTISAIQAASIESVPYNNAVGLGANIVATTPTKDVTYTDLLEMFKTHCIDSADYGLRTKYSDFAEGGYPNQNLLSREGDDYWAFRLSCDDGSRSSNQSGLTTSINIYELLNNDANQQYTISAETDEGANKPGGEIAFMQQWIVGTENSQSFLNWMTDQFSSILGGIPKNDMALQYAYNQVYDLVYPNERIQELGTVCVNEDYKGKDEKDLGNWTEDHFNSYDDDFNLICTKTVHNYEECDCPELRGTAVDYIGGVYSGCGSGSTSKWDGGGGRDQGVAFNLNHLAEVFLTAFKEYLDGIETSPYVYNVGKYSDAVLYKPKSDDIFTIVAETEVDDGTENLIAGFYDTLFNVICVNGWSENDNITDVAYMQELLKSGAVYISSMNNDGCYYQNSYSTDTYISEVADTEGIAQAEAKYNAQKAKIENKENTIDLKMKNLDTEISSLTTEYDTMKGVISKAIEKSFKRYDA